MGEVGGDHALDANRGDLCGEDERRNRTTWTFLADRVWSAVHQSALPLNGRRNRREFAGKRLYAVFCGAARVSFRAVVRGIHLQHAIDISLKRIASWELNAFDAEVLSHEAIAFNLDIDGAD